MADTATARTYPFGVPSWIDLGVPDPVAAEEFYGRLFGWSFEPMTPPGVPAYAIIRLDGADVGGLAARDRVGWRTYVAVDDIEATVASITDAGGTVIEAIEAGGEGGWSAVCADREGVELGLWQAKRRLGSQVVNVPGAWNFSDLHAAGPDGI